MSFSPSGDGPFRCRNGSGRTMLLLSVISMLSLASFAVIGGADVSVAESGSCGPDATWEFDSATKTLTISGTGKMVTDSRPWSAYYYNVYTIVISDGITEIGDDAFLGFYSVDRIELGNTLSIIGRNAFYDCYMITHIDFPDTMTYVGEHAFERATILDMADLPAGCVIEPNAFSVYVAKMPHPQPMDLTLSILISVCIFAAATVLLFRNIKLHREAKA